MPHVTRVRFPIGAMLSFGRSETEGVPNQKFLRCQVLQAHLQNGTYPAQPLEVIYLALHLSHSRRHTQEATPHPVPLTRRFGKQLKAWGIAHTDLPIHLKPPS